MPAAAPFDPQAIVDAEYIERPVKPGVTGKRTTGRQCRPDAAGIFIVGCSLDKNATYEMPAAIDRTMPQLATLYPMAGMTRLAAEAQLASALPISLPSCLHGRYACIEPELC